MDLFTKNIDNKRDFGERLEELASQYLVENSLIIIEKNYLCKMGEIDIIAKDADNLVFIEVRYRKSQAYGGPLASVDRKKQRRLSLAANHYLQKQKLTNKVACRFDVIAITGSLNQLDYNWIKAAFNAY